MTTEYKTWKRMRQRCSNPKHQSYRNYGGRGISVCDRWNSFKCFLADMGERPAGRSIDRIDNDGNYEPANCRWATRSEQELNKRPKIKLVVAPKLKAKPKAKPYVPIKLAEPRSYKKLAAFKWELVPCATTKV